MCDVGQVLEGVSCELTPWDGGDDTRCLASDALRQRVQVSTCYLDNYLWVVRIDM